MNTPFYAKTSDLEPELSADIYYLSPEEGGRHTPVFSGYRGQFYYDEHNWIISQEFIGTKICEPGQTVAVNIITMSPRFHYGKFYVGKTFEIKEGPIVVANGIVTEVLCEAFNYWDYDTFYQNLSSTCQPYSKDNMQDVIELIRSILDPLNYEIVHKLTVLQNLTRKNEMLTINCFISKKDNTTYDIWNDEINHIVSEFEAVFSYRYYLYKLDNGNSSDAYRKLKFAFYDKRYLTGAINFYEIEI